MNCVVLLEDCVRLVEGETVSSIDTCVTGGVVGPEEGGIQVEETAKFPAIQTKHQVRLQGVCVKLYEVMS
jgi:hypothetical protein